MNKKGRLPLDPQKKRVKVAITLTPEHHAKTAKNRSKIITKALKEFFEKSE